MCIYFYVIFLDDVELISAIVKKIEDKFGQKKMNTHTFISKLWTQSFKKLKSTILNMIYIILDTDI